ncbi:MULTISPECIES: DoxX family protein [Tsukamurella]|uniref:DoxX family protein n=2 Tax=Tsukamurella TaxID=2060 RepID=A0A5C5S6H5_9ACTN|nr:MULTISPECIES: DoxX family protein [Tsukamurella]NMD57414.1 DoxX family protein [Tsukamurella columbiensis]TWS29931.1 DoxX family protein [Tsukamurella conjunctivitidis]
MTAAIATDSTAEPRAARSKSWIAGMVLTVLIWAFLVFDVVGKLTKPQAVIDGTLKLGFQEKHILVIGLVLLVGVVLWTIPRTAVIGAIYLTGYLGGAVAINLRAEQPIAGFVLSGAYVGVLIWVAMILRRPDLRRAILGR